jgi:hypothetical protein
MPFEKAVLPWQEPVRSGTLTLGERALPYNRTLVVVPVVELGDGGAVSRA